MNVRSEFEMEPLEVERYELRSAPVYCFDASRREFVQILGAGLAVVAVTDAAWAQRGRRGRRGRNSPVELSQRFHIADDGTVTMFTSKVEVGQGSRTQLTQAAAEELRLPCEQIRLVMADTEVVPDDGGTAGSRTTPATVPTVRRAAATLREILIDQAASQWDVPRASITYSAGVFSKAQSDSRLTLADVVTSPDFKSRLDSAPTAGETRPVAEWDVLGTSVHKVTGGDVVTGAAKYPSDISLPGMLYGKVLRPPSYGAKLTSVELAPARSMAGVVAVHDGDFVGCAAPNSWEASQAVDKIAPSATWDESSHLAGDQLFDHFKETASENGSGWNGPRVNQWGDGIGALAGDSDHYQARFTIPYIQHAPLEPRAAVAQWESGKLTVWTGSQQPARVKGELQQVFRLADDKVRVIVPDTGGGFGGKHTGEVAVEAARLAKAAGKPVSLRWTREEEFTWAYFRPAGLIEVAALLDDQGRLAVWDFSNYNSGGSAFETPYEVPHGRTRFLQADSPLRQGSYRALASTANTFAREAAMDALAECAGVDPLDFRLRHLPGGRLKDVLVAAADKFGWKEKMAQPRKGNRGIGLACGTEKGSYTGACVEIEVADKQIRVAKVTQAFECGAIQNPTNLRAQVAGCIMMGLGGALREEILFSDGRITNPSFSSYLVPRMSDLPELEIELVNRPDLASVGAGETPIIAIAPAIANALSDAVGMRLTSLPLRPS